MVFSTFRARVTLQRQRCNGGGGKDVISRAHVDNRILPVDMETRHVRSVASLDGRTATEKAREGLLLFQKHVCENPPWMLCLVKVRFYWMDHNSAIFILSQTRTGGGEGVIGGRPSFYG